MRRTLRGTNARDTFRTVHSRFHWWFNHRCFVHFGLFFVVCLVLCWTSHAAPAWLMSIYVSPSKPDVQRQRLRPSARTRAVLCSHYIHYSLHEKDVEREIFWVNQPREQRTTLSCHAYYCPTSVSRVPRNRNSEIPKFGNWNSECPNVVNRN